MGKVSSQADKERIEFGRRIEFGTIINEGADFKVGSWMDGRIGSKARMTADFVDWVG